MLDLASVRLRVSGRVGRGNVGHLEVVTVVQAFRRSIRPVVVALLRALPSPEGCGCKARKEWMIRQIEAI